VRAPSPRRSRAAVAAQEIAAVNFEEPRTFRPIEIEEQIALLPRNARCKGMFFQDMLERAHRVDPGADVHRLAGLAPRRYIPVLDYPHADWMRLAAACAAVINPRGHTGEGLRMLGRHAYDAVFLNPLGKVLFGPLGFNLERVIAHAGLGYRLGLNFGRVESQRVDEAHFRVEFSAMPTFLETYNVGVIEGAIAHYHCKPQLKVAPDGWSHLVLDARWE
jgi:uncharacterized protein (TIGR02265 family)